MAGGTKVGTGYIDILPRIGAGFNSQVTSQMSGAGQKSSQAFGQKFSSGLSVLGVAAGNVLANGVSKVVGTISSSIGSAMSRVDTLNNFPRMMQNIGLSGEEAASSINKMSEKLKGLPTTLDSGAAAVQRFSMQNKDIGKSTEMFLALNNAVLAGTTDTQLQATAIEQMSQAYAKGKPDMVEWKSALTAMGPAIEMVATEMGMTSEALGEGLRSGAISMDEFFDALMKVNTEGVAGFSSLEQQAKDSTGGMQTAIANFHNAITRSLADAMNAIGTQNFANIFSQLGAAMGDLVTACIPAAQALTTLIQAALPLIRVIAPALPYVVAGFIAFKKINSIIPVLSTAGSAFKKLISSFGGAKKAASTIGEAGTELAKTGKGIDGAGTLTQTGANKMSAAFKKMVGQAAIIASIGVMVAGIGAGFYLMAQAAATLSSSGGLAIGVFGGMVAALGGLLVLVSQIGPKLTASAPALIAIGAMVALVGAGFFLMAQGAAAIAAAGPLAVATFAIMGGVMIGLVAVIGVFGAQLTAASIGLAAIGIMVVLVGAGFMLMATAATMLASAGTGACVMFGVMLAGIIALVAVIGIFGVGLTAATPGLLAFGAAILLAGAGIAIAAVGISVLVNAITGLAMALPIVAQYGIMAAMAFTVIGASLVICAAGAVAAGAGFVAMGAMMLAPLAAVTALMAMFVAMDVVMIASTALLMLLAAGYVAAAAGAAALGAVIAGIRSDCEASVGAMQSLQGSVDIVGNAISGLSSLAEGAISSMMGLFDSFANNAGNAMNNMWNTMASAFSSGSAQCTSIAQSMVNEVNSILSGASANAWSNGYNIGQGMASGMQASVGAVRAAANELVEQAKRATEAKAQIQSPSKLFRGLGQYISAGLAQGIFDGKEVVNNAAQSLIDPYALQGSYTISSSNTSNSKDNSNAIIAELQKFRNELPKIIKESTPDTIEEMGAFTTELVRRAIV